MIEATLRAGLSQRGESLRENVGDDVAVESALPIVARRLGLIEHASPFAAFQAEARFVDGAGNARPIYAAIVAGATNDSSVSEYVATKFSSVIAALADGSLPLEARRGGEVALGALAARAVTRELMGGTPMPREVGVAALRAVARGQQSDGTFLARTDADAPEPRWYDELAILHALSCFASEQDDAEIRASVTRAVTYHAAETQPDHASIHPFAIAAFLAEPNAIPLADMMLHAAGVQSPRTMDAVSLLLLADALDCGQRRAPRIMPAMPSENAADNSSDNSSDTAIAINPQLLNILRCPLTRSPLKIEGDRLVAERGGLRYPVRNGIPVLLVEEAELPDGVASLDELKKQLGL